MSWISIQDEQPKINEMWEGSGTGHSDPVLVFFGGEEDGNGYQYAVWRMYRGGRGDTTSIHWDWDYPIVTHWKPLGGAPKCKF